MKISIFILIPIIISSFMYIKAYPQEQSETRIVEYRAHLKYERDGADIKYESGENWIQLNECETVSFDRENPVKIANFGTGEGHIDTERYIPGSGWEHHDWCRLSEGTYTICRPNWAAVIVGNVKVGAYVTGEVIEWVADTGEKLVGIIKFFKKWKWTYGAEFSTDTLTFLISVDSLANTGRFELLDIDPSEGFSAYVKPENEDYYYYLREIGDYVLIGGSGTVIGTNVEPTPIPSGPSLTQWGLLILVLLLIATGVITVIRRQKTATT